MAKLLNGSGIPIDGSEFLKKSPQENPVFAAIWRIIRSTLCVRVESTGTPLTQMEALELMQLVAQAYH